MKSSVIITLLSASLALASCSGESKSKSDNSSADETTLAELRQAKDEADKAIAEARRMQAEAKAEQRKAEIQAQKNQEEAAQTISRTQNLSGRRSFSGKIGGKYAIVMEINLTSGSGSYYYTKYGPSNRMTISVDEYDPSSGRLVISEYNPDGDYTGEFRGFIDASSFSGSMTNYKGKTYSFDLRAM